MTVKEVLPWVARSEDGLHCVRQAINPKKWDVYRSARPPGQGIKEWVWITSYSNDGIATAQDVLARFLSELSPENVVPIEMGATP